MSKRRMGCLIGGGVVLIGGGCLALIVLWLSGIWWIVALAVAGQ